MRRAVRESHCRVHILARAGRPFVMARVFSRAFFALGAGLFAAGMLVLGSFVWNIKIVGTVDISPEKVYADAALAGLKTACWGPGVDPFEVANAMLLRNQAIAWCAVEVRGMQATITVVERKTIPPASVAMGDIVARKPGLISRVVPTAGAAVVQEGQMVSQGDALISGTIILPETPPRVVQAAGLAEARVWYEGQAQVPFKRTVQKATGRKAVADVLIIGGREFVIRGPAASPYKRYQLTEKVDPSLWRNAGAPVETLTREYTEMVQVYEELTPEQARQEAIRLARENAETQVPRNAARLKEWYEENSTSEGTGARYVIEVQEDIGEFKAYPAGYQPVAPEEEDHQ
jgi:similar to stage IV sporulation protein